MTRFFSSSLSRSTPRHSWLRRGQAVVLALLCGAAFTACNDAVSARAGAAPVFHGVDITGAEYARTLSLTDQYGQPRSLADFQG